MQYTTKITSPEAAFKTKPTLRQTNLILWGSNEGTSHLESKQLSQKLRKAQFNEFSWLRVSLSFEPRKEARAFTETLSLFLCFSNTRRGKFES